MADTGLQALDDESPKKKVRTLAKKIQRRTWKPDLIYTPTNANTNNNNNKKNNNNIVK